MTKSPKSPARDIEAEMFDVFVERGSQTEKDLLRLGYTQEQIATYGPKVAQRLHLSAAA